ncbi:hypothetical protein So717_08410 [Roseobacter cerasinus]|uniref:Uncharacterized protein n=1 Tax=Roseobacter cerasinus TaxID=2602289 RepID=A0A640VKW9_9RHOB|nr:hypothetical protein [Roseobacter cerasinus]GFE49088.1 hypothetical protein So717_08410 [Roseobacter cerasinus]
MPHLWLRTEQRDTETRTGLTPKDASALISAGVTISVEVIPDSACTETGVPLSRATADLM